MTQRTFSARNARRLTAVAGVAVLALTLAACTPGASGSSSKSGDSGLSGQVVWADYGGTTNAAWKKTFFDPFTAKTGVKVTSATIAGAVMNRMLDGGKGDYDTIFTDLSVVQLHKENLVKLPSSVERDDQLPASAQDYAFGAMEIGYAQGYLASTFPNGGPQTWADFWNVKKFPGKRAVPGVYFDYMVEAALLADGVQPADLYPLDLDRAFKKLDELKGNLVFYTEYPQIQQLLTSGGASIAFGPNGLYAALNSQGVKTTVSWNQAFLEPDVFVIPKSAPDIANTTALAQYVTDPKKQAAFSKLTNYGPGSSAAFAYMSTDLKESVPNAASHTQLVLSDATARAKQYDELDKRYTEWLTQQGQGK
ncbi:ABC transporter substrate-binding protein [soil metagenome]